MEARSKIYAAQMQIEALHLALAGCKTEGINIRNAFPKMFKRVMAETEKSGAAK
jgi:hypothetical protein